MKLDRPYVVVVIAAQSDAKKIQVSIESSDRLGLRMVLFTSKDAARWFDSSEEDLRVIPVASYPLRNMKAQSRRGIEGASSRLASFAYRATRAARHRLTLPDSVDQRLEILGERSRTLLPRAGDAFFRRVIEPLLRVLGFLATRVSHTRVIVGEVDRLLRRNTVIGVSCLDDASLLPGWLIARRYPTLPVVAGFPDDWGVDRQQVKELFELGDTW